MRLHEGRVLLSASDLNTFLACRHASALDFRADVRGERLVRAADEAGTELVKRRGDEHEQRHFEALRRAAAGEVVWLEQRDLVPGLRLTEEAICRGAALIFQGVLGDGAAWHGYADFLVRSAAPSDLGGWSYEVHDTKLARSVKAKFAVQLAVYADLVARVQGTPPPALKVVLGNGTTAELHPRDYVHYVRRAMRRLERSVARDGPDDPGPGTAPEACAACPECGWRERCDGEWLDADHLQAVANIRAPQIRGLNAIGVGTVAELAALDPAVRVRGIDDAALARLRAQAALQASVRGTPDGRSFELLQTGPGRGLARLTPPDPHDLFFDMEGDPLFPGGNLEYLFGAEGADGFRAFWARDRDGERAAFEAFVDHACAAMAASPGARIYHYNHYEPTALKRLAMAYGTREAELDGLLRGQRFVDLFVVVREAMRTSEPGLSLKHVERFYRPARGGAVGKAVDSIVAFERWLETGEQAILDDIEDYNRDDCASTRELRDWLLTLRPPGLAWGERPEPTPEEEESARKRAQEEAEAEALRERLLHGAPAGERPFRELVGHLVGFHRREAKPEWWAMFARQPMTPEELADDLDCIAALQAVGDPVRAKQSWVQAYSFPEQETKLDAGARVVDTETSSPCGTVRELDLAARTLKLGWGVNRPALPRALSIGPSGPVDTRELHGAVRRFAESVVRGDRRYAAVEDMVRRDPPRLSGRAPGLPIRSPGESTLEAALQACRALDGSYLFLQGPPGTGKTWTASRVILDALRRGLRVGVSAFTHKAISNLLSAVERAAAEAGFPVLGCKRSDKNKEATHLNGAVIRDVFDDKDVPPGARLVGATAFYWAKPAQDSSVDLMVVDEARQVSLANLVATCTAASNVVLVGDQMQLGQPVKGTHPGGCGVSALEHLLGDAAVAPPHMGVFLDETRRMHPGVCGWVSEAIYDGRLSPHASCQGQAIMVRDGGHHPAVMPAGLSFFPVDHEGRAQRSDEEVAAVKAIWEDLQRHSWRDQHGAERPVGPEDVLVVAPWNAQVNAIRRVLPASARVGTVDRFQGQEAAAVIVSMATSGTDAIPRGLGFLFSRERLNVAVSRARCLAVVVASPKLLDVSCNSVDDMRLVNTLCWLEASAAAPGAAGDTPGAGHLGTRGGAR